MKNRMLQRRKWLASLLVGLIVSVWTPAVAAPRVENMVGAMLMVGFRGTELPPAHPILRAIRAGQLGGVILFDYDVSLQKWERNIRSKAQLAALTATLRAAVPAGQPFFIAIDQEGGLVQRAKPEHGFTRIPSAHNMATMPLSSVEALGGTVGKELREVGVTLNLAPCVDVNITPNNAGIGSKGRSFSADPTQVVACAGAFLRGMQGAGILGALKHFPGHGSAFADSHFGVTDITQTWAAEKELLPYTRLLAPAQGFTGMVLVGHVLHRELDPQYPASLSQNIIEGLLRSKLGWNGVVITDDLQMQAVASAYDFETLMERAVFAGNDMLLLGNNLQWDEKLHERAYQTLLEQVRQGRVSTERLAQSWRRLQALYYAKAD